MTTETTKDDTSTTTITNNNQHIPILNHDSKSKENENNQPPNHTNRAIDGTIRPPDGGWGWVVVAASFYCCAIVDGFASVVGVLLPQLVDHFEGSSHSQVAMAGSLYAGMFLLSGIVASTCINHLGCRTTTIIGTIISTISILLSTTVTSIYLFILLFGVVGGFGIGLVYSPASVMVNYYFFHRRGLANGIACSGAGAGILILSPLAEFLSDIYGWKGCLWIMAAFGLQCAVCGALMRPLKVDLVQNRDALDGCKSGIVENGRDDDDGDDELGFNEFKCRDGLGYCSNDVDASDLTNVIKNETFDSFKTSLETLQKLDVIIEKEELKPAEQNNHPLKNFFHNVHDKSQHVPKRPLKKLFVKQRGNVASLSNSELTTWMTVPETMTSTPSPILSTHPPHLLRPPPQQRNRGVSECFIMTTDYQRFLETSISVILNPFSRVDAFYSGSVASLHKVLGPTGNAESIIRDMSQQNMLPAYSKDGACITLQTPMQQLQQQIMTRTTSRYTNNISNDDKNIAIKNPCKNVYLSTLRQFFNFQLFTNLSFLIISVSSVFIQLAFFVPILFLADYVQKMGFSGHRAALLLSLLGGSNMVGRAVGGALASISCINILHLNCLSLIVAGMLTGFLSLFVTFGTLIFYVLTFGLFVAFFIPLTPMFLVKYLGLQNLTNSFGMLCMIKGIATMTGPPIAGWLYQLYGSYDKTFYFGGAMFVMAGLSCYTLAFTNKTFKSFVQECACVAQK